MKRQSWYGPFNWNAKKPRLSHSANHSGDSQTVKKHKESLPIYNGKDRLVDEIRKNDAVIVVGETASGKTTQTPQYLLEAGLDGNKKIAVTQPRRVAAISVATRVAQELNSSVGSVVGYSVRFEDCTSNSTRIKYLTDGMLLREAISEPLLSQYSIIILDEVHERTLHTDVLFGVIKDAQRRRAAHNAPNLKVVVMSATMDVDAFSRYWGDAPVLYVEGRQHHVDIYYTKESHNDYLLACLQTVIKIHRTAKSGEDILVFLTGQEEIEAMAKTLRDVTRTLVELPLVKVSVLYATLPTINQMEALKPSEQGHRKIILATNIAETSITIPGIKYVVDSGMVKQREYRASSGIEILSVRRISQASAWQRTGRAGRESRGACYRAYTKGQFATLRKNTIPEIQRCNPASAMLQLLAIGGKNLMHFDFMDKPSNEILNCAAHQLERLGAVDSESNLTLTQIGRQMVYFPLEPRFSRALLASQDLNCTDDVISVIALLSTDNIFVNSINKRDEIAAARKKFESSEGDFVTMLNVFFAYKSVSDQKQWCRDNYLHHRNLSYALDIRKQLRGLCSRKSIPCNSCGKEKTKMRQAIAKGLFLSAAELQADGTYLTLEGRQVAKIHPTSVLFRSKPSYIVYHEIVHTTNTYLRNVCPVDPRWLADANPRYLAKLRI